MSTSVTNSSDARDENYLANAPEERSDFGMQKMALVPGKHYNGTFWINEYGEFQCKPSQEGANPAESKLITEGSFFKLYSTKNLVRVIISVPKGLKDAVIKNFTEAVTQATVKLMQYDFRDDAKTKTKTKTK